MTRMKKFNTAGPSVRQDHCMIDSLQRMDVENIEAAQALRGDVEKAIAIVSNVLAESASLYLKDEGLRTWLSTHEGLGVPVGSRSCCGGHEGDIRCSKKA